MHRSRCIAKRARERDARKRPIYFILAPSGTLPRSARVQQILVHTLCNSWSRMWNLAASSTFYRCLHPADDLTARVEELRMQSKTLVVMHEFCLQRLATPLCTRLSIGYRDGCAQLQSCSSVLRRRGLHLIADVAVAAENEDGCCECSRPQLTTVCVM